MTKQHQDQIFSQSSFRQNLTHCQNLFECMWVLEDSHLCDLTTLHDCSRNPANKLFHVGIRIWWRMLLGGVRSEESIWLSKNSYRTSTEEVKIDGRKPPSGKWLLVFTNYPVSPMTLSSSSNLILTGCHVVHAMVYFKELDTLNMFTTPPITLELLHHLHSNCNCPLSTLNIWKGKLKRSTSLINSRLV
jgi:hypothetical protein